MKTHSSYTFRILVSLGLWALLILFNAFTQQRFLAYMQTVENRWMLSSQVYQEILLISSMVRVPANINQADRKKIAGEVNEHIIQLIALHSDLALNVRGREMQDLFHREGRLDEDIRQFIALAKAAQSSLEMGGKSIPISVEKSMLAWFRSQAPTKMGTVVSYFEKQMGDSRSKLSLWNYIIAAVAAMTLLIQYFGVFRPMGFEIFESLMREEFSSMAQKSADRSNIVQFPIHAAARLRESGDTEVEKQDPLNKSDKKVQNS
ncbi:MAG TPA: hypothetical protein PLU50_01145 [Pseudobdellovibrionaceae bacterium]|nr:hypothetical protein [Pseudobdellovibrionaceae bacterium]